MAEAYIIDAVRTPRGIGKVGKGALANEHPQHLAATVLKAIKDRNNLDTSTVDDVIWSTSTQDGKQAGDMGRMASLDAGYDITSSGTTLDRFCGGGITSVNFAAAQIMSGMEDCVVAGGTEMMSLTAEMSKEKMAAGIKPPMMGGYNERLQAVHPQSHQGICGDAIASIEGYTREELDEVGYRSQQRADAAVKAGKFDKSVVPVVDDEGTVILAHDEYPRPQTTREGLAELSPAFTKIADMPLGTQSKILRVLVDQQFTRVGGSDKVRVDLRVISSTSRDLEAEIEAERFREELYHRLNVVPIPVPSLEERREDIPLLGAHFIEECNKSQGLAARDFSDEAAALMQTMVWPGNVRQLKNLVERVLILGDGTGPIEARELPSEQASSDEEGRVVLSGSLATLPLREAREAFEREYLLTQINRFGGNISRTANFVGMERSALHRKLKSLGVVTTNKAGARVARIEEDEAAEAS